MGLRFARAPVVSAVISGMMNLNAIGSNIGHRNGGKIFVQSPKWWGNILSKVTTRRSVQSNWSRSFWNTWYNIRDKSLRDWKKIYRKTFCLLFSWKIENSPSHCRNSKYVAGKKIWSEPTEPGNIISREIYKLFTCKLTDDWCSHGQEGFFNSWSHSGG